MARPRFPEPKFFLSEAEFTKGTEYYQNTYFNHCRNARAYGEKSTSYFESEAAARRINAWFPDCRIIVSLRSPVLRAVSNYLFSKDRGLEPRTLREVFVENVPAPPPPGGISVNPFHYLERGRYLDSIRMYKKHFGAANVKILIMENAVENLGAVQDVYEFLGVERRFVPAGLHAQVRRGHVRPATVAGEVLETLAVYYEQEIQELGQELGQDLSIWKMTASGA
jgi:hypothetical protein